MLAHRGQSIEIDRLLADAVLSAELDHRHAAVALPEDVHHLLRRELARPHRPVSFVGGGT
jgi:hypothetical protein